MKLSRPHLIEGKVYRKGTIINIKENLDLDKDTLIDWIDIYKDMGDLANFNKYKDLLKSKYSIDYIDKTPTKKLDPFNIFKNKYDIYKKYITNKNITTSLDQVIEIGTLLGLVIDVKPIDRAYTFGETIFINSKLTQKDGYFLATTFIHELGHYFVNYLASNNIVKILVDNYNASTNYGASSPSECGAEHFLMYFIEPKYLKEGWKLVYNTLDDNIPSNYKKFIKLLGR